MLESLKINGWRVSITYLNNKIKVGEKMAKERFVAPLEQEEVDRLNENVSALYTIEYPKISLEALVVPKETEKQIRSILTKIKHYDLLYNKFGLKEIDKTGGRTLINFYGPPGTGKSFAAEAIAKELGKKILKANYAQIESKFVGETPKNIKEIFRAAKKEDAVVLFDEADSILGSRLSNVTQSTDHAVNVSKSVMLLEMDNFDGVMIFTTNFGENYDAAFVRRIIGHVKFELPDEENRKKIFLGLIPSKLPLNISEEEFEQICKISEGLSGGDLLNMVLYASSSAVERDGEQCQIVYNDFREACYLIKKAKDEIGKKK